MTLVIRGGGQSALPCSFLICSGLLWVAARLVDESWDTGGEPVYRPGGGGAGPRSAICG